jgi:NAD(P)-dependent dehydrogenase (short-subunit alcohol dehydrogenase family)
MGYAADVRIYSAVECALQEVHEAWDDFDVLISGAAGNFPAPALGISPNSFQSVIDIDLGGSFHMLRAAYPMLGKPGCSVINISAPQAFLPLELHAHVCAAKAGVDMLTRVMALEWGGAGLPVNSIFPRPIEGTEGMRRLAPKAEIKGGITDSMPLGRFGQVQDIANAALLLSSPLASYISGVILPVDGVWALDGA